MGEDVFDQGEPWNEDEHPTAEELAVAAEDNGKFPAVVAKVREHCGTCDACTELLANLKQSPTWRPS